MRDLFVCYAGVIRSKLAAEIAKKLARERGIEGYEADSCGILSVWGPESIVGYDRVFVMSDKIVRALAIDDIAEDEVINLNVTGELERDREDVARELEGKLDPFFANS